jgi:hypothetical protein
MGPELSGGVVAVSLGIRVVGGGAKQLVAVAAVRRRWWL